MRLPEALTTGWPPKLRATDERGWFRFQRLYDMARACVRDEEDMRRIVREAAQDDAAEGSGWLEIQVDPTSYAPFLGGITPALEIVLDEARTVSAATGTGVAVVVAASRMRHPLDARTLARLAARYAGEGPGTVVGFGLSNDERRGRTGDFAHAFDIARRAGLACVPHGGELLGADAVAETLTALRPDRLGHGVRSVEDPRVLDEVVRRGVTLEVCPGSNVALGVYPERGRRPGAPAARGGGPGGPRRRRPAAVRVAAGRAVRARRGRRWGWATTSWRPWPAGRCGGRGPRSRCARPCSRTSTPGWRHPPGPDPPQASVAASVRQRPSRPRPGAPQSEAPTRTGSLTRVTPKVSCTPSRISRARARTSAALALPRLVRARVCLVDRAAGPGMR